MKWKTWLAMMLLMTMSVCAVAQGSSQSVKETDEQVYRDVLDSFYALIVGYGEYEELGGGIGVLEATAGMEKSEALASVGYCISDVSGDGVKELLIGRIVPPTDGAIIGEIYAIYTCEDDVPMLVAEGWARSRYYLMLDNKFLYEGSASAFESAIGVYELENTIWNCKDFYFTTRISDKYGVYYNKLGEWDTEVSQKVKLSEFSTKSKEWTGNTLNAVYMPFSEYTPSVQESVRAQWGDDVRPMWQAYHVFILDQSDDAVEVLFSTDAGVTDFKLFELTFEDVSESGEMLFKAEKLYEMAKLSAQCPLMVKAAFYGSIPNMGISYVDASGMERYYSVGISGFDGSLILSEIQIVP